MRDKNEERETVLKENTTMSENSISSEIVNQFMKEHAPDLQAFKTALDNLGAFQKKERDCLSKINLLRAEIGLPMQESASADDVEKILNTRRNKQKEIVETEETLKNVSDHFLKKAKKELEVQNSVIFGILGSIVNPLNKEKQVEIDGLFDQVKMLVKDFETQVTDAMIEVIGTHFHSITSPQSRMMLTSFSFKNAPIDLSIPFALRGLI